MNLILESLAVTTLLISSIPSSGPQSPSLPGIDAFNVGTNILSVYVQPIQKKLSHVALKHL